MQNVKVKELLFRLAKDVSPIMTISDIENYYPDLPRNTYICTLQRMQKCGEAMLPWKGIYIISPKEYFGEGEVHVREYLDVIMRNSGRGYYVALKDAIAELITSYENDCKTFHVIEDGKGLPNSLGKTVPALSLNYTKHVPSSYIYTKETRFGYIKFATAELTAIDLVTYIDSIGGLQASVDALKVLSSKLNFRRLNDDIFEYRSAANVQRLGYIIENVLGKPAKAQPLHDLLDKRYNKVYARNALASALPLSHKIDKRWQLDVNIELK